MRFSTRTLGTLLAAFLALASTAFADLPLDNFDSGTMVYWNLGWGGSGTSFRWTLVTVPGRAGLSLRLQTSLGMSGWVSLERTLSPQNWNDQTGVRLLIYGQGPANPTTTTIQVWEVRGERWEKSIVVNWSGWKEVTVPFSEFTKAWQPAGVVSNGVFERAAIGRFVIALSGPIRNSDLLFDDVAVYGTTASKASSIIPLYAYPISWVNGQRVLSANWAAVIQAAKDNPSVIPWAIINPDDGPGLASSPDTADYAEGIRALRSAGVKTLGYVRTGWAGQFGDVSRTLSVVKREIDAWPANFGAGMVDGIFFDEGSNEDGASPDRGYTRVQYYSELSRYAKSKGATLTVNNPGAPTQAAFIPTADVTVIYENKGFPAASDLKEMASIAPKSKLAVLVYGQSSAPTTAQVANAKQYVGIMYTTNDTGINPWDDIPSVPYLNALFRLLP